MPRILVVDDEDISRTILRELLEAEGYDVLEADTSDRAVEIFQTREIDLIVTDMFLPPDGGLGVIENVRKVDADISIVVVSGISLDNRDILFERARQMGATHAIEKPVEPHTFKRLIADLLAGSSAANSG